MNTRIVIVANGNLYTGILSEILPADFIIGVDRAAYWLIKHGVIPHVAIGDFDSCNKQELNEIRKRVKQVKEYAPEKDFTDTELALSLAFEQNPEEIVLFGGSGSRIDHMLATLSLLEQCLERGIVAVFQDETNEIVLLSRGRTILIKKGDYRYISILPYTKKITISLQGLKYPLSHKVITQGQTIGISNEFAKDKAVVDVHAGKAFIIRSRD